MRKDKPMPTTIEQITKSIINLSNKERLEIARMILFLDNQSSDVDTDPDWEKEILERVNAIEQGTAIGLDYNKAIDEIKIRLHS
jgi:hypothetical protein